MRRTRPGVRACVLAGVACLLSGALVPTAAQAQSLPDRPGREASLMDAVEHHYADSDGVSIHYVTLGDGPLVVLIHGFPDFWYTWRHQMPAIADAGYRVAAMDTRGYNRSDRPEGVEAYEMSRLVDDVAAVIRDQGEERAVVVGHDWGGMIAWSTAMSRPELVERLVVLNLPHPKGLSRELAANPAQQEASQYARDFQEPGSHQVLSAEALARWVRGDEAVRARYVDAFERSSLEGMMAYYKANYPRPPYREMPDPPPIGVPVLQIHGLDDPYLLADALNGTWAWIDAEYTLVTLPGVGHFVQQDAAEVVTRTILDWLGRRERTGR